MRYANEALPGIDAHPHRQRASFPEIQDEKFWGMYTICSRYSLLHITGFYNLYQSLCYMTKNGIKGDYVECGVLFGGASIFAHLVMSANGDRRKIHLFDTFEGSPPESASLMTGGEMSYGFTIDRYDESVRQNARDCGANLEDFVLTRGKVEDTLPGYQIGDIACLRLDTDFYPSTRAELEILYPKLSPGGAIIIDDYGCFQGARDACDEYFASSSTPPLLNRIDTSVWAGVKPRTA